ncbi:F-box/kelch-repeat protein At1g67480-like [Nymphaea colorata]|nr:F-box/kelch-repeat protein At1g67480-like [Nymphaea colorata]XP_049933005.1 F-box/kelch-repeat protein At1g67480-like [Nymphaea colorata]
MCLAAVKQKDSNLFRTTISYSHEIEVYKPILPGLPDDIAKYCLALVAWHHFPVVGCVCKKWRSVVQSNEFSIIRKHARKLEERIYFLCSDKEGKGSHWEVFTSSGHQQTLLPMPGPAKAAFGVVTLDSKILVMGGYIVNEGPNKISADVYQYDCRLNRWSTLAKMNVARCDFASAEVDGLVYVVGGYGADGQNLPTAEAYDPGQDKWTLIGSMRSPRWGSFAFSFDGKLYVMGGRSSFTIGNSRFIDVYDPKCGSWSEMKNGRGMVTTHAVLQKRLFCMEWKNPRRLYVFNPAKNSWKVIQVPVTGSSCAGFRLGILDGKLLLFSTGEEPGYQTLTYDLDAAPGSEWVTSSLTPPWSCLYSVTIKA